MNVMLESALSFSAVSGYLNMNMTPIISMFAPCISDN